MAEIVHAPWTVEQVKNLNDFQHSGVMHPFTCSGGGGPHSDRPGRPAILIASEDGWRCPVDGCKHQQDWAHTFMADGSWREAQQAWLNLPLAREPWTASRGRPATGPGTGGLTDAT